MVEGSDATGEAIEEHVLFTGEAIEEHVLSEIAPYRHPRHVHVREEFPKAGGGKIRTVEL